MSKRVGKRVGTRGDESGGEESGEEEWSECCEKHGRVECDDKECSSGYGEWRGWAASGLRKKLVAMQQLAQMWA